MLEFASTLDRAPAEEMRARGSVGMTQAPRDLLYAALDLGTNNCRMLVARPHGRGFRVVDAFSRPTRLGEGVAVSGRLSMDAMDRTIEALRLCADRMARRTVAQMRCVATEACRRAANGAHFAERVLAETGLKLDIISAEEEAGLALAGCSSLLDRSLPHALVFDIGGGSTELIWVKNTGGRQQLVAMESLPLGVVTLAEREPERLATAKGYGAVVAELEAQLRQFEKGLGLGGHCRARRAQMLGTSGTVTTLAGVHLNLRRYDRSQVDGLVMEFSDIRAVSRQLAETPPSGRGQHPCIGAERADLVVAGCAILEAICRVFPAGRLTVADRGVREGVLLGMMRGAGEPRRFRSPREAVAAE